MTAQASNPRVWEGKTEGSRVQKQPEQHSETVSQKYEGVGGWGDENVTAYSLMVAIIPWAVFVCRALGKVFVLLPLILTVTL